MTDTWLLARNYAGQWLAFDIVTTFPWDTVAPVPAYPIGPEDSMARHHIQIPRLHHHVTPPPPSPLVRRRAR